MRPFPLHATWGVKELTLPECQVPKDALSLYHSTLPSAPPELVMLISWVAAAAFATRAANILTRWQSTRKAASE